MLSYVDKCMHRNVGQFSCIVSCLCFNSGLNSLKRFMCYKKPHTVHWLTLTHLSHIPLHMSRSKRTVGRVGLLFISGFVIELAVTLTGVYSASCVWPLETGSDYCSLQQVPKHTNKDAAVVDGWMHPRSCCCLIVTNYTRGVVGFWGIM